MSNEATGTQELSVAARIKVTPSVVRGPITVTSAGPAVISTEKPVCSGTPAPDGTCTFWISQILSVEVPLTFDAEADIDLVDVISVGVSRATVGS